MYRCLRAGFLTAETGNTFGIIKDYPLFNHFYGFTRADLDTSAAFNTLLSEAGRIILDEFARQINQRPGDLSNQRTRRRELKTPPP